MQNIEELKQYLAELTDESALIAKTVVAAPGCIPTPCFPEVIAEILGVLAEREWEELTDRARNYLKWITVKAESIDALAPRPVKTTTRGFELLAIDRDGNSFGDIVEHSQELAIPSVMVRFASLIATFLTVRLLRLNMERDQEIMPSLTFTQNVDTFYLNYPRTLKTLLELFPEYQQMFYFEINEDVTEDYLTTIRLLAEDLGIRLALDDTNKMDVNVHHQLLDLADWIKIDFQATAYLEEQLLAGDGENIIQHFEEYALGARSPVIVFEGLTETSPLKDYLEQHWKLINTVLYFQSRERSPVPPWNKYFGLMQDYHADKYGLFFKGLINEQ
ncbi:MAG: hypothetical protein H8E38_08200 [SAR324 cluster bacterium]|nr:hypothetical protein [SAR324 cluster bacterium]MBL7035166.1 hypothetical protein [SAR324 cluster bacterium]